MQDSGNFEAYPHAQENTYYTHHTLKVLPTDTCMAQVEVAQGKLVLKQVYHWFQSKRNGTLHYRDGVDMQMYRPTLTGTYIKCETGPMPNDAEAVAAKCAKKVER